MYRMELDSLLIDSPSSMRGEVTTFRNPEKIKNRDASMAHEGLMRAAQSRSSVQCNISDFKIVRNHASILPKIVSTSASIM